MSIPSNNWGARSPGMVVWIKKSMYESAKQVRYRGGSVTVIDQQNKAKSLQRNCPSFFPLRIWNVNPVRQAHEEIGRSHYRITWPTLYAKSTSIESMFIKAQVRWNGHVIHMEQHGIPRCLLYEEWLCGKRHQGQAKKLCKDAKVISTGARSNQRSYRCVLTTNCVGGMILSTKPLQISKKPRVKDLLFKENIVHKHRLLVSPLHQNLCI